MKYITVNFVLLLLFFISFSLGDELGFPESLGNVEGGGKKRSLDIRSGGNTVGVLPAVSMPVAPVRSGHGRPTASSNRFMQINTMKPQLTMSSPRGFNKPQNLMTGASSLPLGVPPFKSIPFNSKNNLMQTISPAYPKYNDHRQLTGAERFLKTMASTGVQMASNRVSHVYASPVPAFQALPSSITSEKLAQPTKVEFYPKDDTPEVDLKGHTVEELAAAAHVSVQVIQDAINLRKQQMLLEKSYANYAQTSTTIRTTQSTTTSSPPTERPTTQSTTTTRPSTTPFIPKKKVITKKPTTNNHKVMNAPKEYYPAGYDKNFDDNFKSKIDLPATSFHCGDQKHFPGLYGDQDLGCMVFHVCALTDDGLVMKSFLCPESTLFDQTVLKCNWWFYTDCKASSSLYDSNLPVSKSYQLMKSLSYFNQHYKKTGNGTLEIIDNKFEEGDAKLE